MTTPARDALAGTGFIDMTMRVLDARGVRVSRSDAARVYDAAIAAGWQPPTEPTAEPTCTCFVTPESEWLSAASCGYGSGYEPGSQMEWNPDCPVHPPTAERAGDAAHVHRCAASGYHDHEPSAWCICTCGERFDGRAGDADDALDREAVKSIKAMTGCNGAQAVEAWHALQPLVGHLIREAQRAGDADDAATVLAAWLDRDDVGENRAADEVRERADEVNALLAAQSAAVPDRAECTNPPDNSRAALDPCADPKCPVHGRKFGTKPTHGSVRLTDLWISEEDAERLRNGESITIGGADTITVTVP